MSSNTIVKIILFIFFTTFFGFLFWYFYQPNEVKDGDQKTEQSFVSQLFPFGDNKDKDNGNRGEEGDKNQDEKNEGGKGSRDIIPRLRQISKIPTAGVHIETLSKTELFDINKNRKRNDKIDDRGVYSEIRYVAIKNNHVYSTYDFTLQENRISNTSILKIFDAQFFDKNNFIVRYRNNFGNNKTYSISLRDKTDIEVEEEKIKNKDSFDPYQKKFQGVFFPDSIENIYINQKSNKVFYTTYQNSDGEKDGNLYGITATKGAEVKKEIFVSEIKEWDFDFSSSEKILANTKASAQTYSIPFVINIQTGVMNQIQKSKIALQTKPNNNFSKFLFSYKDDEGKQNISIKVNSKNGQEDILNIATFAEKCVWSKDNITVYCAVPTGIISRDQPDNWYKGRNYFRDDIYKINTKTGVKEIVFDALLEEKNFDIIDLKIDDREKYLYWRNKPTDFAWSYELPVSNYNFKTPVKKIVRETFSGEKCESNLILTQNLQPGDRDGKYSTWQKEIINEVVILQKHMNRLGFNAGVEDGILGRNTSGAIKRMQKFLGTFQDAKVGPITRGLLNNSC